mgnify:CR=1 FL=1
MKLTRMALDKGEYIRNTACIHSLGHIKKDNEK